MNDCANATEKNYKSWPSWITHLNTQQVFTWLSHSHCFYWCFTAPELSVFISVNGLCCVLSVLWHPQENQEVISQNMLPYYCTHVLLFWPFKWQVNQNNWRMPALKTAIIHSVYEIGVISQTKRSCDLFQMAYFLLLTNLCGCQQLNNVIICWPVLCCCVFTAGRNICWPISVCVRASVSVGMVSHSVG